MVNSSLPIHNYIATMNMQTLPLVVAAFLTLTAPARSQITPLIEVQGQTDVSPFEGQQITVSGKVTEFFGDTWYLQDDYGAWNGIYVVGPDVVINSNPPYWSGDRQPEVGDVLTLTGNVAEVDGNTQLIDPVLDEFVDFWNATPMGVWLMADQFQDESYEGTRVRIDNATVVTAPDANGMWVVTDGTAELACWGLDTDDPSNNEDPDGPTPGDVYKVYGSLHQMGESHVLHMGDIDVLSLDVPAIESTAVQVWPNPASDGVVVQFSDGPIVWELLDAQGRMVMVVFVFDRNAIDVSHLTGGVYHWRAKVHTADALESGVLLIK